MTTRRTFLKLMPAIGLIPLIPIPRREWIVRTWKGPTEPQTLRWTANMEPILIVARYKTKEEIIKEWEEK